MEEDTGKLTHLGSDTGRIEGATTSLIDYNRAGVPLIEIVTKPIEGTGERAPEIARAYVTALRDLLRGLGVSDVRMDQGSMRCDSQRLAQANRDNRVRHPHRDQERELAQERGGGGPLRDAPSGSGSGLRRPSSPGDPALPRGRLHVAGPQQGDRARTTATSPNPIWSRLLPKRSSSRSCGRPFRSIRGCSASAFRRTGASPTR